MDYDLRKYHRRSIRLKGYDYSQAGAYFVTICLYGREPYLEISAVHAIAEEVWNALPQRFPTIALYDHIIRNEAELQEIRQYICDNPIRQNGDGATMRYEGSANIRPKIETHGSRYP